MSLALEAMPSYKMWAASLTSENTKRCTMLYADQIGLFNVVQAMNRFATNPLDDAEFWKPAPLLAKLAAEGKTFN